MKSNTDSSNLSYGDGDFDYSSDSSHYYLYDKEKKNLMNFVCLVFACQDGPLPWDSDPVRIANFLKEINEKYGWNIPIDMDDIKKKLAITDKKIKKMRKLYNNPSTANVDENPIQETTVAEENPVENQEAPQDSPVLFIRRKLTPTDMSDHQNRLSMPCRQVINGNFLTSEEMKKLQQSSKVPAKLIDPGNRTYDINLRLTKAGRTTFSYAIGKPWNEIKKNNGFETGMELDVLGLRGDKGEPCFVLKEWVET